MGRIIAVANQKGGVGKTTTAINLSACLAEKGKRVLTIDIDPQGNTSSGLGVSKNDLENTVYQLMIGACTVEECMIKNVYENLSLLPSNVNLAGAEIELIGIADKEYILKKYIDEIKQNFDFIIIDCPPSLNTLTVNAMTTADTVLVPIQCEYFALEGLTQLIHTINLVKKRLNPNLEIEGVVFTMFDARTNLSLQVVENVKENLQQNIYKAIIPRNVRLAEAPSHGIPINFYDPKSSGAEGYRELAEEVIERGEEKMVAKRGLGKGLDSMIPEKVENMKTSAENGENVSRETLISINEIEPNKLQPRKNFDEDSLHELAESIKQFGIIQPIVLQKKGKFYEIIAGERRWRAARIAGLKKVPAVIKEYTAQEIVEIALIENIQREDLNPIEEALAYQRLILEFQLKQDDVAERVSKSRTAVTNSMRLLKLCEKVQQMLIDDNITSGHARALISIEDQELQYGIATKVFDEKLSVRETEKLVKKILESKPVKQVEKPENDIIYKDLEERIKTIIGTKVSINRKTNNKGKIEIEYYSGEELERIMELFFSISGNE